MPPCWLLLAPLLATARAQDPPEAGSPEGWTRVDTTDAAVPWKDRPIEPKAETDGTAHTLGQGRVRLGLVQQAWGPLANVDLRTNAAAFLLGFPNAAAKVTAIQTGPIDVAVQAGYTWMDLGPALGIDDATGSLVPVRWTGTWTASEGASLHLGNTWNIFRMEGVFDTEDMVAGLGAATGTEIDPELLADLAELDESSDVFAGASLLLTQSYLGLDYRLNRRDSLLFRATTFTALTGTVRGGFRTTDAEGSDTKGSGVTTEIGSSARIVVPLTDQVSVLASLSWQWSWERLHLRVGVPIPVGSNWVFAVPQAFSLHWVLGGRKA